MSDASHLPTGTRRPHRQRQWEVTPAVIAMIIVEALFMTMILVDDWSKP
jgi:hypothetical protein